MQMSYYYLHTNGNLIYKSEFVVKGDSEYFNSPMVKKVWNFDMDNKKECLQFLAEARSLNANDYEIRRLTDQWDLKEDFKCTCPLPYTSQVPEVHEEYCVMVSHVFKKENKYI